MITLEEDDHAPWSDLKFWMFIISCVVLVLLAGITSGLALGLLSLSQVELEVLIKAGLPKDRKHAGSPSKHHYIMQSLKLHNLIGITTILLYLQRRFYLLQRMNISYCVPFFLENHLLWRYVV